MGASDLVGEGWVPGQDGGQRSLVTSVKVQEPLHLPAVSALFFFFFLALFKGSETFFHMYLWGSRWKAGMVGAGSEPLPRPGSLPSPRASLGTFVI